MASSSIVATALLMPNCYDRCSRHSAIGVRAAAAACANTCSGRRKMMVDQQECWLATAQHKPQSIVGRTFVSLYTVVQSAGCRRRV